MQTTTVLPDADLTVTVTDFPDPLKIGSTLTYTLVVVNNGPSPATTVMLTDTLPVSVIFGSISNSQGICSGTSTITCNLDILNSGLGASATIIVTPTVLGTLTNIVHVSANEPDLNLANNIDTENTMVRTYVYLPVILK